MARSVRAAQAIAMLGDPGILLEAAAAAHPDDPRYAALASHYLFTPKFCMPATATEMMSAFSGSS